MIIISQNYIYFPIFSEFQRIADQINKNLLESLFIIVYEIVLEIIKKYDFCVGFLCIILMDINDLHDWIDHMEDLFLNHEQIILHLVIIEEITQQILLKLNNPKNLPTSIQN
jgi:hypothetical protein